VSDFIHTGIRMKNVLPFVADTFPTGHERFIASAPVFTASSRCPAVVIRNFLDFPLLKMSE